MLDDTISDMISHGTFSLLLMFAFGLIVFSLGKALFHLLRDGGSSGKSLRALTWRISLSVGLILVLIVGERMGVIAPRGVTPEAVNAD